MENSPQLTRLVQAIKGTGRFSNPKARVVVSLATTRDQLIESPFGDFGSVRARASATTSGNGIVSITDPAGNLYAMTNIMGAAQGATLG
jgi:hypothetical protein